MLLAAITIGVMVSQAEAVVSARPPRPSDESILQKLVEQRPEAIIIEHTARNVRDEGRVICGFVRHSDTTEPFAAYAIWKESSSIRIIENGRAAPVPPAQWMLRAITPVETPSSTGEADRTKRNINALQRRLALNFCPDLFAPDGVQWTTALEPDPDPNRQRLIEQRARAMTDMLFRGSEGAGANRLE